MRHYHIRFIVPGLILLALGGCNPAQRQEADRAGGRVAHEGRELVREAREKSAELSLAGKVETALKLRHGLDVTRIEVKADALKGTVTLAGSVPNMEQRRMAEEVARNTDGVHQVVNRLAVPPETVSRKP